MVLQAAVTSEFSIFSFTRTSIYPDLRVRVKERKTIFPKVDFLFTVSCLPLF
jgi:hypothetical protein